jgi:hypothetical protein
MNLKELHEYTGRLLAAGVSPSVAVTALVEGYPREIQDVEVLEGPYAGDASPKLIPSTPKHGRMLALCPVRDDFSEVANDLENGCKIVDVDVPK